MSDYDAIQNQPIAPQVVPVAVSLLTVDVAGRRGADGANGVSYAGRQAGPSQNGRSGGDAALARAGEEAGNIEVSLASDGEARVLLAGRTSLPGRGGRDLRESIEIGESGSIFLIACGGDGGHGGTGGDGEAGGQGRNGADATQFSWGENGGPGADGGDGGIGTSGERGGDGGEIIVKVDDRDTQLLMLSEYDCAAGRGGDAGVNGRGGPGGPGGRGGNSYTWTTSSTETYYDAAGHPQTRTNFETHHNPGGMNGPPGRPGRDGRAALHAGADGTLGMFRIRVADAGRVTEFTRRYEAILVDYDLELEDAFAEPTSTLRVRRLVLKNAGGMPTPRRCPTEVRLAQSQWVAPSSDPLALPAPLAPGEQHIFEQELLAHVPDVAEKVVGDPLRETDSICPLAWQPGANRPFLNQHEHKSFPVAFAGEVESVHSLESQTPGRAALMRITITNNSRRPIGRRSATARVVGLRLGLRNAEMAAHLMLITLDGRRLTWEEGLDVEIDEIESGKNAVIEAIVGVLPSAPGYTEAELTATLRLGELTAGEKTRERHERVFGLRIAQAYVFDPEAEILFIANHGTTRDEKAAWEQAAARLGKRLNIWDISLNDSLSLSDVLGHGDNLLRDFHGKTIVLANGAFDTSLGKKYGDQFISQMDLIKAAESHGIRVLVINAADHDVQHLFRERLVPTDGQPEFRYPSISAFRRRQPMDDASTLLSQVRELVDYGAKAAKPNPLGQTSEISLSGIRSPSAKRLRRQAARLQRQLEEGTPGRRYVVAYQLPGPDKPDEPPPPGGFFFSHVRQGTLTVMPTVGDNHPNFIVVDGPEEQIHSPEFVGTESVTAALVQSLSFQDKVYLLDAQLRQLADAQEKETYRGGEQLAGWLVDAILVDLAAEQAAVLKSGWQGPMFSKQIATSLESLRFLAEYPFELSLTEGEHVRLIARLLAGIEFLGRHASRWYESRVFPWGFFRRGPALRGQTLRLAAQLKSTVFGRTSPQHKKLIDEQLADLARLQGELRRREHLESKQAARGAVAAGLSRNKIRTDAVATFPRVLSHDDWETVRRKEDEREIARVTLQKEKTAARESYLLAMGGQPLPGVDSRIQAALRPFIEACESMRASSTERAMAPAAPIQVAAPAASQPVAEPSAAEPVRQADRVSA
jgi:hypothetical protein